MEFRNAPDLPLSPALIADLAERRHDGGVGHVGERRLADVELALVAADGAVEVQPLRLAAEVAEGDEVLTFHNGLRARVSSGTFTGCVIRQVKRWPRQLAPPSLNTVVTLVNIDTD